MRGLLFPLLAMLLLARIEAAGACSRIGPPPSDEELFAAASAVFVGHIFRVEEAEPTRVWAVRSLEMLKRMKPDLTSSEEAAIRKRHDEMQPVPSVEGTFRVVEVLKGSPPPDGKVPALPFVFCSGAIAAGVDYLFFLYRDNFVFIDPDDGTRPLLNWPDRDGKMERQQRTLEKLRALSKTVQE